MEQCLCNLYYHRRLPVDFIDKYHISASNPSIFYDEKADLFYLNVRNTNYKLKKNSKGATECTPVKAAKGVFDTLNYVTVCHTPMEDSLQWYLVKERKRPYYNDKHGLEDARLVKWRGKFYLSGTLRDYNTGGMGRITLFELDNRWEEVNHFILEGTRNDCSYCEKNHMCVIDKPFTYVASTDPTVVYKADLSSLRLNFIKGTSGMCIGTQMLGSYRGSSQAVPYKDGYLAVVHHSEKDEKGQYHYYHHFAIWDKDFNLKRISQPYKFEGGIIEFCCGLAIKDEYAYITYSVMDAGASIVKIPLEDILNQL